MWKEPVVIRSDYHQRKENKNFKAHFQEKKIHTWRQETPILKPILHSSIPLCSTYIINWGYILYSCSRHKVLWYILSEYMKCPILSSRQTPSEHIYFNNNFCASWRNETSGFKFVLCFFTAMVIGAVIFPLKMQINYHLDSQTWTTWMLAFLPTVSFI